MQTTLLIISVVATVLKENSLLSIQQNLSQQFYRLTVTSQSDRVGHLSITAFPTTYGSDPDIFISKVTNS